MENSTKLTLEHDNTLDVQTRMMFGTKVIASAWTGLNFGLFCIYINLCKREDVQFTIMIYVTLKVHVNYRNNRLSVTTSKKPKVVSEDYSFTV